MKPGPAGKSKNTVFIVCIVTCAIGLAGLAGFLIPYISKFYDLPILVLVDNAGKTVAQYWESALVDEGRPLPRSEEDLHLSSIFTPIEGRFVSIPMAEREGVGGAITSWGEDVVLITHEGKIYVVDKDLKATAASIEAPFNGFDDYVAAAAQPPFDKVEHSFFYFRYNDIKAFEIEGQKGLLVSYTRYDQDRACYSTTISRLNIDKAHGDIATVAASANDWVDIFATKPCLPLMQQGRALAGHMAGARIVFDGNHTVYLASGDYDWDGMSGRPRTVPNTNPETGPVVAQDSTADYGKVIAIDLLDDRAHHLSKGHRNTQGIAIDREGSVWVVEHGVRGGDELNRVTDGGNYGWPLESYGTAYTALPLSSAISFGQHDQFLQPMLAWLPSIAVSGLTRVEGFHETWDGDLLASSLRGQKLARIRVGDNRVIFSEFIDVGHRIRHVHQHTDGRIVLWTDDYQLIFLSPAAGGLGMEYVNYRLDVTIKDENLRRKTRVAINACVECHSTYERDNTNAPSLANVFDSKVGSTSYGGYSENMVADPRTWSKDLLVAYLAAPEAVVPGTLMPNPHIGDEAVREEIAKILEGLATDRWIPEKHRKY